MCVFQTPAQHRYKHRVLSLLEKLLPSESGGVGMLKLPNYQTDALRYKVILQPGYVLMRFLCRLTMVIELHDHHGSSWIEQPCLA